MKLITGLAAATAALGLAGSAHAAPGEYVSIVQETTINAPADVAWNKLKGYCDIGKWLIPGRTLPCEVIAGQDGELGSVRKIAGSVEEVIVARTPHSYTYADLDTKLLYHGTVEVRPVDKSTSKLVYTLFFDQASIPEAQREANKSQRSTMFAGALKAMKAHVEAK